MANVLIIFFSLILFNPAVIFSNDNADTIKNSVLKAENLALMDLKKASEEGKESARLKAVNSFENLLSSAKKKGDNNSIFHYRSALASLACMKALSHFFPPMKIKAVNNSEKLFSLIHKDLMKLPEKEKAYPHYFFYFYRGVTFIHTPPLLGKIDRAKSDILKAIDLYHNQVKRPKSELAQLYYDYAAKHDDKKEKAMYIKKALVILDSLNVDDRDPKFYKLVKKDMKRYKKFIISEKG